MKKIGLITFHSSHNYGSNLLVWSFQRYLSKFKSVQSEVIDFRTHKRDELYSLFKKNNNLKNIIKNFLIICNFKKLKIKYLRHEMFIEKYLKKTSKIYKTNKELKAEKFNYDVFISCGDQIWNTFSIDFDWSYFLNFSNDVKKASYSVSMGPLNKKIENKKIQKIQKYVLSYDYISVRESGTCDKIKKIINEGTKININIDPVFLVKKAEWEKQFELIPTKKNKYIFYYSLNPSKENNKLLNKISKILNMPVVISKMTNQFDIFNNFEKQFDSGPIEFLNLIYNAELVISSSFHGNVFAMVFQKPFYALNGKKDNRINHLLKKFLLEDRYLDINNYTKCKNYRKINYKIYNKEIDKEIDKTDKYIKKILNIEV